MATLLVLGLSPILIGESTRGVQVGRAYYPALLGLLLFIGYTLFQLDRWAPTSSRAALGWVCAVVVVASGIWNLRVFLTDVWPARMAPAWLARTLKDLGTKALATYHTPYNDAFLNAMSPEDLQRYQIQYIHSLREVREGYVVVPGTNAKALNMVDASTACRHDQGFEQDPLLDSLIVSRAIQRYAIASFKTFGTSRIWVHEDEVTSYRDLILNEVSDQDRWRGRAWILDARRLFSEEIFFPSTGWSPVRRLKRVDLREQSC